MNTWEWAQEVFETSWRASWLILALVLLRPALRRWVPARLVFAGWLIVAIHLLVPVGIPTSWSIPRLTKSVPLVENTLQTSPAKPAGTTEQAAVVAGAITRSVPVTLTHAPTPRTLSLTQWLIIGWAVGVAVLVLMRAITSWVFARTLRQGSVECSELLRTEVCAGARLLGLGRAPDVVVSHAVEAPAIFGLCRPVILFPPGFAEKFSEAELKLMILHELGHWWRRDIAANTLIQAVRILHWFNPLVWIATRLARQDCELACDEFVMRRASSAETHTYGATLLKVLGVVRGQNRSPQVLGILENKQQLKRRIQMIVNYRTSTVGRMVAGVVLLVALTFVAATREARADDAGKIEVVGVASSEITTKAPTPWFKNGSKTDAYVVSSDPTQPHVKPVSAYIKSIQPEVDGFGGMMQSFSAQAYRGRRVRLSAWVRSEDVKGTANIWMRVDGTNLGPGQSLQFDNMKGREIVGTTGWTKCSVVLDVSDQAVAIAMGFFISGAGHAWFNDAQFEVVGTDVPSTNIKKSAIEAARQMPLAPRNLDFGESATK